MRLLTCLYIYFLLTAPSSARAKYNLILILMLFIRIRLIALLIGTIYIENIIGWYNLGKYK